ncbi:MAG: hypothetical protein WCF84_26795 [Anaerolineae bacterium]
MRILSVLGSILLGLFTFVFLPLALILIAAAAMLGIGSLMTRFFAVTTFEATLLVTLVAIPLGWGYMRFLGYLEVPGASLVLNSDEDELEEDEEEAPEPPVERWMPVGRPRFPRGRGRQRPL